MYQSKEIRWFFRDAMAPVIQWFDQRGITFDSVERRTDHYLRYGKSDIGIKLREGRAEVKYRIAEPTSLQFGTNAHGALEHWTKWSFNLADADHWSSRIINGEVGENEWIAVGKLRLGVKRTFDPKGKLHFVDIREQVASACQVELTRLLIGGKTSYTLGIEWYGEKHVPLEHPVVDEILGGAQLPGDQSMGYPEYLMQFHGA